MREKIKSISTIIVGCAIIFSVIFCAISMILSIGEEPDIITKDEVKLYIVDANRITDYNTYYYIEACLDNLVESVKRGKLNDLYKLYLPDYVEQYTKDEVYAKLNEFSIADFRYELKDIYIARDLYVLKYELNGKIEYMFMQIGTEKGSSYNFAIIK